MSDFSSSSGQQGEVRCIILWFVNFVNGNEDVKSTTDTHGPKAKFRPQHLKD